MRGEALFILDIEDKGMAHQFGERRLLAERSEGGRVFAILPQQVNRAQTRGVCVVRQAVRRGEIALLGVFRRAASMGQQPRRAIGKQP